MKSVNKELAILLKKAGFSEVTNKYYKSEFSWDILYDNYGNWNNTLEYISIPTIEDVLVWLRTKMGMHVYCIHSHLE